MTRSVVIALLAILCAGLVLWSFFAVASQSVESMPAYRGLAALTGGKTELATYRQGLLYRINGMQYDLLVLEDILQKDLTQSQRQTLNRLPQAFRDFLNEPSLRNAGKFTGQTKGLSEILDQHGTVAQGLGLQSTAYQLLLRYGSVAVTVCYGLIGLWLILCLLFILLGYIRKKQGFIIATVVMHTLICLCLWSILWAGVALVMHLALFYCLPKGKKLCGAVDFQNKL